MFTLERDVKKSFQGPVIIYLEEGEERGVQAICDWVERGLNFMIKKFRMGVSSLIERYIFQIFFLLFVPVIYLTIVTELSTMPFFS